MTPATTEPTALKRPSNAQAAPNPELLQQLAGLVISDLGAAANGALTLLGDRLGIYRALAESGPVTSAGLAARTSLDERYLREWLASQTASGYVAYAAQQRRP